MTRNALLLFVVFFFLSCFQKLALHNQYQFNSNDGSPDYTDLFFWAAHPWKWDPSDSIPAPLKEEKRDTLADVFFLHPTTYTSGSMFNMQNAPIDNKILNAKTDYTTILYQASVFNQHSRVFAPRYRQAHFSSFFIQDTTKANKSFDLAYNDLKTAFEHYLKHWNQGRPLIIASHSQGSKHAARLLNEFFEGKKLKDQLVAAYIIGWPVPKDQFRQLKMCMDSLETGCICSWRTFKRGYTPYYIKKENGNSYSTNPLTWKINDLRAPHSLHKGSVLRDFNKINPHTTDAQVNNGVLWVSNLDFPGSFLFTSRNYHIGDINLFYINLRENIEQRILSFLQN